MRLISLIASNLLAASIVFGATAVSAQTTMTASQETYLGAVAYPGGLMERAGLRLSSIQDLKYLRIDMPSFCSGEVFEVGYVSNGQYLKAERVSNNVFSVNYGRGMLSDGVYLSINGPLSAGCSVLVFKLESSTPAPTPAPNPAPPPAPTPQEYAYTCLTNAARGPIPTNVVTSGGTTQGVVYPGQTVIINSPVMPGRVIPALSLSYDADASLGYFPVTVPVVSTILPVGNCQYAPLYQYVEDPVMRRLNLVRLH